MGNFVEEIKKKTEEEIEDMLGNTGQWSKVHDRGFDFGLIELQRRAINKNVKTAEKLIVSIDDLKSDNKISSRNVFIISGVAVAVALTTVIFSYIDNRSDEKWKSEQIQLLQEISEK